MAHPDMIGGMEGLMMFLKNRLLDNKKQSEIERRDHVAITFFAFVATGAEGTRRLVLWCDGAMSEWAA